MQISLKVKIVKKGVKIKHWDQKVSGMDDLFDLKY